MAYNNTSPDIPDLVGQRVFHTAPGYGYGQIVQAYLTKQFEIYIRISFDNKREANPFSLIKCINKGLIVLTDASFDVEMLTENAVAKERQRQEALREAEERQREENAWKEAERKKREEERINALLREREERRGEAEKKDLERLASEAVERKRIFDYLTTERNVQFLVHFTPVSNLPSILTRGILPRSIINREGIPADFPDEQRFDSRMDYSSFSVSFPNYRVFYSKRMTTRYTYAVLIIDPQLIMDLPLGSISYLPNNAASGSLRKVENYTGLKSVKALFTETVLIGNEEYSREQLEIPDHFATNPQAEVFIRSAVEPKYIRSVIVADYVQANQLKEDLQSLSVQIPRIIYNKEFYRPRVDWRFWSAQSDAFED